MFKASKTIQPTNLHDMLYPLIKTWNDNTPPLSCGRQITVRNWRNSPIYNPKPNLRNINEYTRFGENPFIITHVIVWTFAVHACFEDTLSLLLCSIIFPYTTEFMHFVGTSLGSNLVWQRQIPKTLPCRQPLNLKTLPCRQRLIDNCFKWAVTCVQKWCLIEVLFLCSMFFFLFFFTWSVDCSCEKLKTPIRLKTWIHRLIWVLQQGCLGHVPA